MVFYTQNWGIRQEAVKRALREVFGWITLAEDGGGRWLYGLPDWAFSFCTFFYRWGCSMDGVMWRRFKRLWCLPLDLRVGLVCCAAWESRYLVSIVGSFVEVTVHEFTALA